MNSNLKKLEIKRIIKEYLYLLSDLEYKNLFIKESESEFSKEVYEKLGDKKVNFETPKKKEEEKEVTHKEEIKKIYREIVKKTHPDKDLTGGLTEEYKEAVNAYKNNNVVELYIIADKLNIDYTIDLENLPEIKKELEKLKEKINYCETTYVYLWATNDNKKYKEYIINQCIKALDLLNKKEGE
jgi:hypothetical protein